MLGIGETGLGAVFSSDPQLPRANTAFSCRKVHRQVPGSFYKLLPRFALPN